MKVSNSFLKKHLPEIIISLIVITMRMPGRDGEDIVNARNNFESKSKIDFWGGSSSFIYGHFPNFFLNWQTILVCAQILIVLGSIILLNRKFRITELPKGTFLIIGFSYFSLILGSQTTRDGLQFSLLFFGLSIVSTVNSKFVITRFIGFLIILVGTSLRPWLSIPIAFIYFAFHDLNSEKRKAKKISVLITIFLLFGPFILDRALSNIEDLESSFPEQQVMLMDFASTYCWGVNPSSATQASKGLAEFYANEDYKTQICQFFRPDTWYSLSQSSQPSAEKLVSDFQLIEPGNFKSYNRMRNHWLLMIKNDPVTWLQNKLFFATKVIVGGDSRRIRLMESDNPMTYIKGILYLPWDIAISFHLMSLPVAIGIIISTIAKKKRNSLKMTLKNSTDGYLIAAILLWILMTTFAYIGANGRYMYSCTALAIAALLANLASTRKAIGR